MIPTNRKIPVEAINAYLEELNHARRFLNLDIDFVVIDEQDDNVWIQSSNDCIYVGSSKIRDIINQAASLAHDPVEISRVLLQKNSYGSAANRLSLVAAYLGYDVIHRRDSDTLPIKLKSGEIAFPIKNEIKGVYSVGNEKFLIGGRYYGDWSLRFMDIAKNEPTVFKGIIQSGFDCLAGLDEYINAKFLQCGSVFSEEWKGGGDIYLVEMGNCCLNKIWKAIPCCPGRFTNGVDYVYHDFVDALGLPWEAHGTKVNHKHVAFGSVEAKKNYYIGFSKWRYLFKHLERNLYGLSSTGPAFLIEYSRRLGNLQKFTGENYFNRYLEALACSNNKEIAQIVREIEIDKPAIMQECLDDLKDYILLLRNWTSVVECNRF